MKTQSQDIALTYSDVTLDYTRGVKVEINSPPPDLLHGEERPPTFGFSLRPGKGQITLRHKALKVMIRIGSAGFTVVPFKKEEEDG